MRDTPPIGWGDVNPFLAASVSRAGLGFGSEGRSRIGRAAELGTRTDFSAAREAEALDWMRASGRDLLELEAFHEDLAHRLSDTPTNILFLDLFQPAAVIHMRAIENSKRAAALLTPAGGRPPQGQLRQALRLLKGLQ